MKTAACTCFVLLALGATDASAAAEMKVGYVDMARAFRELDDSKVAQAELKKNFDGKQKKLDAMQVDLQKKQKDFETRSGMMKAEVKQQKQQELQREIVQLQQTYMKLQEELGKEQGALIKKISDKMRRVVERVGDRDGFDVILEIGDTVLYYKKHQDITDQVIREYNREYGKK